MGSLPGKRSTWDQIWRSALLSVIPIVMVINGVRGVRDNQGVANVLELIAALIWIVLNISIVRFSLRKSPPLSDDQEVQPGRTLSARDHAGTSPPPTDEETQLPRRWLPDHLYRRLLFGKRWKRAVDESRPPPTIHDLLVATFWFILVMLVLAFGGLSGLMTINFTSDPLPYVASILLLLGATWVLLFVLFVWTINIRRMVERAFRSHRIHESSS